MLKNKIKMPLLVIFLFVNTFLFSANNNHDNEYKSKFLAIGNIKIVRPEPLVIKREDINIIIEKDGTIKVKSYYTFKNIGKYNIKSTYMFWLDKNIFGNPENKLTNVKGEYIKNIEFYSNYKKSKNLRAVINFNENIYSNQIAENIQRDWYAISNVTSSGEEFQLGVYYDLINTNFENNKKLVFSFDLVDNFNEKNKVEIFFITINNKSEEEIKNIEYKGYNFSEIQKQKFELLAGNVNLDGKMVINFK